MISSSPNTIIYVSVSSAYSNGQTVETETLYTGIKAYVEPAIIGLNEKITVNGIEIRYTFCIILKPTQRDILPAFGQNDKVTINGTSYKVLSRNDLQLHTEIYC